MKIIKLPNTTHNEMDDNANEEQRNEIRNYVLSFLQDLLKRNGCQEGSHSVLSLFLLSHNL